MGSVKNLKKKSCPPALNANDYKEQGNKYFLLRKYSESLACYTKAINMCPGVPIYYTNRALCHLKMKQWQLAFQDCRSALEYDSSHVKGHFFAGQALLEMKLYDEALASLLQAHELAREQRLNYGDDITAVMQLARKQKFLAIEDKCIREETELQRYLQQLVDSDFEKKKDIMLAQCEQEEKSVIDEKLESLENDHQQRLRQVDELFKKVDEKRKQKRDVPDILCGKISFELMRDPVITPSGITYDRRDINDHLQRVGHFDPVTRSPLTNDQLIPNLAMKEVIDSFLEENPWAEDY